MKDSGIEWIGEIPDEWQIQKMNWICSLVTDYVANGSFASLAENVEYLDEPDYAMLVRTVDVSGKGHTAKPVYISKHSYDFLCKSNLYGGEIILPNIGGVGEVFIVPKLYDRMSLAPNAIMIRTRFCDKYYFYYFSCDAGSRAIKQIAQSTAQAKFNKTDFKQIRALVPPIEEQLLVSSHLDKKCAEIDAVLEKTRESIEEYKKLKQAVITEAVTKGVRGKREMKDSGVEWIGEIPVEWNTINPKALFTQRKDKAKAGEKQLTASQQYGVIYQDEYMKLTGAKVVTVEKDFDILKHVECGDFVISMRSFQGGLEYSTNTGSISSAYVMLIPNLDLVFPRFFKWLLKSQIYINALQSTSNLVRDGQAMRYSNFAQVRLYTVPIDEQQEIADYLDKKITEIDTLIAKKEALLEELETYKKSLIYEYVTGKKRVSETAHT